MEDVTQLELESFHMDNPDDSEIDSRIGVIFHPTDEEMIDILKHKMSHPDFDRPAIYEANIYEYEPYQLRGLPAIESNGNFYFLFELNPLYASGESYRRSTTSGNWKVTCKPVKIKSKGTHEEIGERKTLVFYEDSPACPKGVKTNWFMYEYSAYANNNPLFKKNLVVCRIKEDKNKKLSSSRKDEKEDLVVCGVKEIRSKKRHGSTKDENARAKKPLISLISTYDEGQPSHYAVFDEGNPVAEKSSSELQPPTCHLISKTSVAVENTYPELHYYSVSNFNNHAVEDTSQMDSLPLENLNALNGRTEKPLFPQSPILPVQGPSSSSVSSAEKEVLNSPIGSESLNEDYLHWLSVTQDELTGEEMGLIVEFCGGDRSDVGAEILDALVDEAFWKNTS